MYNQRVKAPIVARILVIALSLALTAGLVISAALLAMAWHATEWLLLILLPCILLLWSTAYTLRSLEITLDDRQLTLRDQVVPIADIVACVPARVTLGLRRDRGIAGIGEVLRGHFVLGRRHRLLQLTLQSGERILFSAADAAGLCRTLQLRRPEIHCS